MLRIFRYLAFTKWKYEKVSFRMQASDACIIIFLLGSVRIIYYIHIRPKKQIIIENVKSDGFLRISIKKGWEKFTKNFPVLG